MIVTAHQPNFLPGASVLTKIQASDVVIWLDEVQYSKGGWTNRNRAEKDWITVPVESKCAFKPINRVRIGEPKKEWRAPLVKKLMDAWPGQTTALACHEILRPYQLLVGLNVAILRHLLEALAPSVGWCFQSHLAGGHAVPVVASEKEALKPISERLASMVEELGGDIYLSGPSGRNYLDEQPFRERDIDVEYWHHHGPNPCGLALCDQEVTVGH